MTIFAQSNPRNGKIIRVYETFGLKYAPNKAKQIHFLIMSSSVAVAGSAPNDSVAMKSETVNPMPPSRATDASICQLARSGIAASFSFIVSHENPSAENACGHRTFQE